MCIAAFRLKPFFQLQVYISFMHYTILYVHAYSYRIFKQVPTIADIYSTVTLISGFSMIILSIPHKHMIVTMLYKQYLYFGQVENTPVQASLQ